MKKLIIGIIAILAIALLIICFLPKSSNQGVVEVSTDQVSCYIGATSYLQEYNITGNRLEAKVRCSHNQEHCSQYEIIGNYWNDSEKVPIYFHAINCGIAASGQDAYTERCLTLGDETIVSEIIVGRESAYLSPARCTWQSKSYRKE